MSPAPPQGSSPAGVVLAARWMEAHLRVRQLGVTGVWCCDSDKGVVVVVVVTVWCGYEV